MNQDKRVYLTEKEFDITFFGTHHIDHLLRLAWIHLQNITAQLRSLQRSNCFYGELFERQIVIDHCKRRCVVLDRLIVQLQEKRQNAYCKPILPRMRNFLWFMEGDVVYVYDGSEWNDGWKMCRIVTINAAQDGTRRIIVKDQSLTLRAYTWTDARIIKEWEYVYFQRDHFYHIIWREYSHLYITYKTFV